MSVDDAELVRDLIEEGLCVGPVYLPEWFIDIDRLNAMSTHSVTMNRFSLPSVTRYYARRRAAHAAAEPLAAAARGRGSGRGGRHRGRSGRGPRRVAAAIDQDQAEGGPQYIVPYLMMRNLVRSIFPSSSYTSSTPPAQ